MWTKLGAAVLALAMAWQGAPASAAAVRPPPIAAFFKRPPFRAPRLSPSGRYLAIQVAGRNDRMGLAVIDLQTMASPRFVAGFMDADVAEHRWISDDRLVLQVSDSPDGSTRVMAEGLWAVDRDGSQFRQLINSHKSFVSETASHLSDRRLDINWTLYGVPAEGGRRGGRAATALVERAGGHRRAAGPAGHPHRDDTQPQPGDARPCRALGAGLAG